MSRPLWLRGLLVGALIGAGFLALAGCAAGVNARGATDTSALEGPDSSNSDWTQAGGWIEAVAIVSDLDRAERFFINVAGYQRLHAGAVDPVLLRAWGLPAGARGRERVFTEPGETRGRVRLVALEDAGPQVEIRSAGQFFDTGAIAGFNVRVRDIDVAFAAMQRAGWRPFAETVRFSVEEFAVAEAVFRGPDGLVIGLIERERPALGPQWRMPVEALSRPNNAFVIAPDLDAARAFYEDVLGWSAFLTDQGPAAAPGPNLYGWPHDLAPQVTRNVVWLHPDGGGEGSVAFLSFGGVEGRALADRAAPPNLGWVALRLAAPPALQSGDRPGEDGRGAAALRLAPYGCVRLSAAIDPAGVRLEFLTPAPGAC